MFTDDLITHIADELDAYGRAMVTDSDGRRLLIMVTSLVGIDEGPPVLLAYEGRGAIFFDADRPMNHFRLLSSGFPEKAARSVSDMVNRLIPVLGARRLEATNVALEGPTT